MTFGDFVKHERSKVLQGKFRSTHYFIRCVKEWSELEEAYGDKEYYPTRRATVRATIASDDDSIFTPCTYQISDVDVIGGDTSHVPTQITSFRGRFCEQARTGDRVVAVGLLERVVDEHGEQCRLIIGEAVRDRLMVVEKRE
jgi:predicted nucleotidyltransferase